MTKPADNTIAKKREVAMPAAAAATMETKARGSATLANSDNHGGGLFIFLDLALVPNAVRHNRCLAKLPLSDPKLMNDRS
jgi:hypothetical protein